MTIPDADNNAILGLLTSHSDLGKEEDVLRCCRFMYSHLSAFFGGMFSTALATFSGVSGMGSGIGPFPSTEATSCRESSSPSYGASFGTVAAKVLPARTHGR